MKRLAVLFLVFGITAAACGDDSGSPLLTSTTTSGPATTTTIGGGEAYPSEMVEAYMDGCRPDGGEDLCRCTIDQYQARLTLQEFIDYTSNTADIGNDPLAQDIIEYCTREGGTTATTVAGGEFTPFADMDGVINASLADLNVYWAATMQEVWGLDYQPPIVNGPYFNSRGDQPTCGGPMDPSGYIGNAFYCGFDDTVQWDHEDLMAPLYEQFGDFTVALVLAHEWGHAIQNRYGFDESNPTIVSELQADCFAGSWTGRVAADESDILRLEPGDLEEAMSGFLLIGDQLGGDPGDDNAHGGSFDRLSAFYDGFNNGAAQCATYETDPPAVVFIPLEPTDDPTQGGDLAYDETAPLLIDALETFWGLVYPDVFGGPWVPVSNTIPYDPNGEVPSCGGFTGQPGFYEGNAFYCAADDFVAWDNVNLFPGLYTDIGDFAIGLVLADEWGRAVQTRAGLTTEGPEAQLQVDCMAGVWTAALVPADNPTGIRLSAGDLEEGISGFLSLSATPGVEGEVSAFQRFEAFKSGFFDGITVCGVA